MNILRIRWIFILASAWALAAQENPAQLLQSAQTDLDLGRNTAAVGKAREAAKRFRTQGDRKGYMRARIAAGRAELYLGNYDTALGDFEAALPVAQDLADLGYEVRILNNAASALYYKGLYGEVMDRYRQALNRVEGSPADQWSGWGRQITEANIAMLFQTLGQPERALELYTKLLQGMDTMPPEEQAQLLTNVGVLRRRLGDPRKALETYRDAQELYRKSAHRDGEIALLNDIGIVQAMDFHDWSAAESTFTTANDLADRSGDSPLAVHARLYRGETRYRAGRMADAEQDFMFAAKRAHELGGQEEEWKGLFGQARIALAKDAKAEAKELLQQAVALIGALRHEAGPAPMLPGFLADKRSVYDLLIGNTASAEEAFPLMEESRARRLLDRRNLDPQVRAAEVARTLPEDAALLEFWTGESATAVIWITRTRMGMKRWRTSVSEQQAIGNLIAALSDPRRGDWKGLAQIVAPGLLEGIPVLGEKAIEQLIIVPDGLLARLPFEALPFQGSLLIERFRISYSPAAAFVVGSGARAGMRWPWEQVFEGFADPAPGRGKTGGILNGRQWAKLPEAAGEVTEIAAMQGGRSTLHLGADARKEWLMSPEAPVIHFATHGFADQENAELSFLLMAPALHTNQFDYLFLKEVYGLPLSKVTLVTLSACETEVGRMTSGEVSETFSKAFLGAGVQAVVTSLWRVGDKSAAELMRRFYERLWRGEAVASALRGAKLEFLRGSSSEHPANWAGFVAYGDANVRLPLVIRWSWIGGLMALVVAGARLLYGSHTRRRRRFRNSEGRE